MIRAALLTLLFASQAFALNGRPEIVVVMDDDISAFSMGAYGEPDAIALLTPQFDSIATNGQLYLNMISHPACTPSRRSIFYGTTPLQHGAGNAMTEETFLGVPWAQRLSLVDSAQAAGWQVKFTGKFHAQDYGAGAPDVGAATAALAMGFDFVDAYMPRGATSEFPVTSGSPHASGNHHYSWLEMDYLTGISAVQTGYVTDVVTDAAVAILQDDTDDRPLLLFIWHPAAHAPRNPPPGYVGEEGGDCAATTDATSLDCYEPQIKYIDVRLEDILAELDLVTEDTIIKLSDNGIPNGVATGTTDCSGGEAKGSATPCGTRVPMAIQGVGITSVGVVSAPVQIGDLQATLMEMVGAPQYESESKSFVSCFTNRTTCTPRSVATAMRWEPLGLPVAMWDTGVFTDFEMHLNTVEGTTLYGLRRVWDDNDIDTFVDTLQDLGLAATTDRTKRYGQLIITEPNAEAIVARDRMTAEITRLIAARYAGPPNQLVGVTQMVGVGTQ